MWSTVDVEYNNGETTYMLHVTAENLRDGWLVV